jgi:dihydroorotase
MSQFDLIIKNGHVIDPAHDRDGLFSIAIKDGKIAAVAKTLEERDAKEVRDAKGLYVVPGLIDIHTHVYWGGTSLSVNAEEIYLRSGTTTFVDAGSSGPGNFPGFLAHIIEPSRLTILAFLNISFAGIFAFSSRVMLGEASFLELMNIEEVVETCKRYKDVIVGVKARACQRAAADHGAHAMDLAIEAADQAGLPIMTHVGYPPPTIKDVIAKCRPGDIITHAFRDVPNAAVNTQGDILPELVAARKRGILLDIGHGMGGFGFRVAKRLASEGIWPDMISSDIHILSVNGPAYDLLTTMSKFLCLGMPLSDIIKSVTATPAKVMRKSHLGNFNVGSQADITFLSIEEGEFMYHDGAGQTLRGARRFKAVDVILSRGKCINR